jgi:hypothetical protein
MSLAAVFMLAAAAAPGASASERPEPNHGVELESARVSVVIVRPAIVDGGQLVSSKDPRTPHSQRRSRDGRITYEFE